MSFLNVITTSFVLCFSCLAFSNAPAQFFNFEGILTDQATPPNPIEDNPVTFTVGIYNPSENCLLREEDFSIDMTGSSGQFNLLIGNGTLTGNDPGLTFSDIFKNNQTFGATANCGSGYTPATTDERMVQVTVNSVSLGPETLTSFKIGSVPTALYAETLQGLSPTDFIQATGQVTQSNLATVFSSAGDVTELRNLIDGNSSNYLQDASSFSVGSTNTIGLGNFTTAQETALTVGFGPADSGKIWFNSDNDQMMYWDGDSAEVVSNSTTTGITSLGGETGATQTFATGSTGTAPAITSGSDTHTLNIPLASGAGVTSGTISKTDYDSFNAKVDRSGDTMSGVLDMGGNQIDMNTAKIVNVVDPTSDQEVATKIYVDNSITTNNGSFLPLAGGTMSGNLLIPNDQLTVGTATANGAKVSVAGDGPEVHLNSYSNTAVAGADIHFNRGRGTEASSLIVQDDDLLGEITAFGWDGTNLDKAAKIRFEVDGTPSAGTDMPGQITFLTTPEGSATLEGRMIIRSDGNVGIGTTSPGSTLHLSSAVTLATGLSIENTDTGGRNYVIASTGSTAAEGAGFLSFVDNTAGNVNRLIIDPTGNIGIGVIDPDAKLEVNGQIKITGGSPGANKVLTSDANGLATWQTPSSGADDLGNHTATQNLIMGSFLISNDGGAGEGLSFDTSGNATFAQSIAMSTNKITGLGDPTLAQDAVTKTYADANLLGNLLTAPSAGQVTQSIRWNAGNTAWEYYTPATGDVSSTRDLIAGNGLSGGGDLSADRTFNIGAGDGISVAADSISVDINASTSVTPTLSDELMIADTDDSNNIKKITITSLQTLIDTNTDTDDQTLDEVYNEGGNTVTVDTSDVVFNLSSTNDFHIQDAGSTVFTVLDDGNVGIGTSTPDAALHLATGTAIVERQIMIVNQTLSGTSNDGTCITQGTVKRALNTTHYNSIAGASLDNANDEIDLPAGTYEIEASAPSKQTGKNYISMGGGPSTINGSLSEAILSNAHLVRSYLRGVFTLSSAGAIFINHTCEFSGNLGSAASIPGPISGNYEFTQIKITRLK